MISHSSTEMWECDHAINRNLHGGGFRKTGNLIIEQYYQYHYDGDEQTIEWHSHAVLHICGRLTQTILKHRPTKCQYDCNKLYY